MINMPTIAHVRGSIAGAAILAVFGFIWSFLALESWPSRASWSIPLAFTFAVVLLGICTLRLFILRSVPNIDDPIAAAQGRKAGIVFGVVFGTEGVLIALSSLLLARRGLEVWIPLVTAAIVGIHFVPLARLFQVRLYYWTAVGALLSMVGCFFIPDAAKRQVDAGLSMTVVLWLTAIAILLQTCYGRNSDRTHRERLRRSA